MLKYKMSMRKKIFLFLLTGIFCLVLNSLIVTNLRADYVFGNPLRNKTIGEIIDSLTNFIFYLAIIVAPLIIIVAGFLFTTAAGDAEKIAQAKKIITWTIIGFSIVLFSKGIVALISSLF